MKTQFTPGPWYANNTAGDHQGLVIDEKTGRTIALTYEPDDAPKLAALPDLVAALDKLHLAVTMRPSGNGGLSQSERIALDQARAALAKVKG